MTRLLACSLCVALTGLAARAAPLPVLPPDTPLPEGAVILGVDLRARPGQAATFDAVVLVSALFDTLDEASIEALHRQMQLAWQQAGHTGVIRTFVFRDPHGHTRTLEELTAVPEQLIAYAIRAYHWRQGQPKAMRDHGALMGRRIGLSPGHGYTFDADTGTWGYQRGTTCSLREDIHTVQLVNDHVIPNLERAGAEVVSLRERVYAGSEWIFDDPAFELTPPSAWTTQEGGHGGSHRLAWAGDAAEATIRFSLPQTGRHSLSLCFQPRSDRGQSIPCVVAHADGETRLEIDERRALYDPDGEQPGVWLPLGDFLFLAGQTYSVSVRNEGLALGENVVVDAMRVGGGRGLSGEPRWRENALELIKSQQVPDWITSCIPCGDVDVRAFFALFHRVDAHLSLHTNAYDGSGSGNTTAVWSDIWEWGQSPDPDLLPPGTIAWAESINARVAQATRLLWDSGWGYGGMFAQNYGELRPIGEAYERDATVVIPAALIEMAFHDNCAHDAYLIRERGWRRDVARGLLKAMIDFFDEGDPADALYPPLPPVHLSAVGDGHDVVLSWEAAEDPIDPGQATPASYTVYVSDDGLGFTNAVEVFDTTLRLPVTSCAPVYFRVTATNAAGESLDAPEVAAQTAPAGGVRILLVDGVDRWDQSVDNPHYRSSFLPVYAGALAASVVADRLRMDSATDDAVAAGLDLSPYDAIVWFTGETHHGGEKALFPEEREALRGYLQSGGSLLMSGAELAWYLAGTSIDPADAAFLLQVLHVDYPCPDPYSDCAVDDAGSNDVVPVAGGPFAAVSPFTFADGSADHYLVEWPDVVGPAAGAQAVLDYGNGSGPAGISFIDGSSRLLYFGFPPETIDQPESLTDVLARSIEFLAPQIVTAAALECSPAADGGEDGGPIQDGAPMQDGGPRGDPVAGGDPVVVADDGEPHAGQPDSGCGCGQTSRGHAALAMLLVLLCGRRRGRGSANRVRILV